VYLTWLGVSALRSALRRDGSAWSVGSGRAQVRRRTAFRQGFVCNITNPKVLAFNLAVLPQFVGHDQGAVTLVLYAMTLVVVGALVLLTVVALAAAAAVRIARPGFRRGIDGGTGVVMLGFATALAAEA
jgi:threonine/homoserine/homoserine lactone efflux protein